MDIGPIVLAVGAGRGCLDIFTLLYLFSSLSPSLWEMARYRLKYCLKGTLNPKQPTNHMDIMSPKFYTTNQLLNGFKIPLHRRYKRNSKQPVLAILSFLFYFNRRIQSLAALIFLQNIK